MNEYQRSLDAFLKAYGRYDVTFDHGKGVYLYDINDKKYLDFYSGIGVNGLGHQYPKYNQAMYEQLDKVMHVSNYFNTIPAIEAAEMIKEASNLDGGVFFTNSGAEAIEGALKLARKYFYETRGSNDSEVISLYHSFHGRTTGAVKLTGNSHYQEGFGPLIDGIKYASINDIDSVTSLVNDKTAAIIVEPLQGEGGIHPCKKEFLQALRKICNEKDIVLILDEVQCGMGRTGTYFTYQQFDVMPDILCLAKQLGCGFPIGAFVANKKVGDSLKPGDHGSTYGGNPMAGQACKTVLTIYKEDHILEHVNEISNYLISKLDELASKYDCIVERRGIGLMQGLEFTFPVKEILQECLDQGLVLIAAGTNVIRFLPPLIIEQEHVDQMISMLETAISKKC